MRVAVFSSKAYDEDFLQRANESYGHELTFLEPKLNLMTAALAYGFEGVCAFVNDDLSREVLAVLKQGGTRFIALRSAGFNHVDLQAARDFGLKVARVPAYSPDAVAEHSLALILTLNRKIHRAYNRVREGNFSLEGLLGFSLRKKTIGVIGTGKIGLAFLEIMSGFGTQLLAYDLYPTKLAEQFAVYGSLEDVFQQADIISLHCPLTPETHHLINAESLRQMKQGVMLINTSRGALIDTRAVITALKSGKLAFLGLDVYEEEADLFFEDLSGKVIQDDVFSRLLTFPNVLITGHQGFFTEEALAAIAEVTLANISAFELGRGDLNEVSSKE